MTNNAETLLALGDELGLEAAKVLVPEPWKHKRRDEEGIKFCFCKKCGRDMVRMQEVDLSCPVPDRIDTTDWNVAMKLRDKIIKSKGYWGFMDPFLEVEEAFDKSRGAIKEDTVGLLDGYSHPRHYIIAAMLAAGNGK